MTKLSPFDPLAGLSIKAIQGKQGFLFLGGRDSNAIVEFLTGQVQLSLAAYRVHRDNFAALSKAFASSVFMVVPEAHVIYDDLLPDNVRPSLARPVNVLRSSFPGLLLYPETELRAARARGLAVYTGLDSHWSESGSFVAYEVLRAAAGLDTPFIPPYEPSIENEIRDLAIPDISIAEALYANLSTGVQSKRVSVLYENGIANHGQFKILSNPGAPFGRCLVFGTSFSRLNLSCYAMDFRETVFCYGTAFDPLLVTLVNPDQVFLEQPERFLSFPSTATPGSTLISHALMVPASGRPRSPFASNGGPVGRLVHLLEVLASEALSCSVELSPGESAVFECVRHMRKLNLNPVERSAMRAILSGAFRREDLLRYLNYFIDLGAFKEAPHLLPATEMGYLGRTRLAVLTHDWHQAREYLFQAAAGFGPSTDSEYYADYLRGR